jgi:NAD(P)-dependent dehydrogenase (short-subunit alcohol dehydrogenase family)
MMKLDVRDAQGAAEVVAQAIHEGGIDVLVNNAGVSIFGAVEEVSVEQAKEMMETNYFAPLRLIQLVVPHMRSKGHGRIVNVSSVAGSVPMAFLSSYCASKHALDALSFCLAAELREFGIRVSIIAHGAHKTSVGQNLWVPDTETTDTGYRAKVDAITAGWHQNVEGRDPRGGAEAIVRVASADEPPMRLRVGVGATAVVEQRDSMSDDAWADEMMARTKRQG